MIFFVKPGIVRVAPGSRYHIVPAISGQLVLFQVYTVSILFIDPYVP